MKRVFVVVVLFTMLFSLMGITQDGIQTDSEIQTFVRSVTVQLLVVVERTYRDCNWYREQGENGELGEWKVRRGLWQDPETVIIAGSGVILYSDILPERLHQNGVVGATYVLTNAHVVSFLTCSELRGTRWSPLDVYAEEDWIVSRNPPSVIIKEGARPIAEEYYNLKQNYVTIKHRVDQLYQVRGEVVAYDQQLDVALVELENVWGIPYASFRGTNCQVGEEIWICGAPLGIPFSIDRGRINQIELNLGVGSGIVWNDQIKLDIPAAPGSSGSGIYDENGLLIAELHGVLVYRDNYIEGGQLAINGMSIREWLIWNGWAFIVHNSRYVPYGLR